MTTSSKNPDKLRDLGFRFDNSYLSLPEIFYTKLNPSTVMAPKVVILNNELATSIGLNFSELDNIEAIFSGNMLPQGSEPFAQAYAGHQFGHFTMLGDGRAHIMGEHITPDDRRMDIQFKGSGRTPYSRSEDVLRETVLDGAILTRVATSHVRVGTFEFAAANQDTALVETLLNYTIERHFPEIHNEPNAALALLKKVMDRQIDLIVNWMRVGFIHGVMNTDNMTISGETIDYGPCAFMDTYDPNTVFSSIDQMGRYAYANQPNIAQWNLFRLTETLLPFLDKDEDTAIQIGTATIGSFIKTYKIKWMTMMKSKLGLFGTQLGDEKLISDLLDWMKQSNADYTNTFRNLSQKEQPSGTLYETDAFNRWYKHWQNRLGQNNKPISESLRLMTQTNPAVIPRNHNVENALDRAIEGNLTPFKDLLTALKTPYTDGKYLNRYQSPPSPSDQVYQTFCGT